MKIINKDFKELKHYGNLTITIGSFDGVHLGHAKLIKQVSLFKDTKSAIMTFDYPNKKDSLISLDERIKKLSQYKPDYIFIIPFSEEFLKLTAIDFLKLLKSIGVKRVVAGSDFTFGVNHEGTINNLKEAFELTVASDYIIGNLKVSSTLIKEALKNGDLMMAKEMLGYDYYTKGEIIQGNGIGASLGYRTANLDTTGLFLPKLGVYYAICHLGNKSYPALVNIGYSPTIKISNIARVEAHLLDFNKDIYGKELVVEYKRFIRTEQKFSNQDSLIKQINQDLMKIEALRK